MTIFTTVDEYIKATKLVKPASGDEAIDRNILLSELNGCQSHSDIIEADRLYNLFIDLYKNSHASASKPLNHSTLKPITRSTLKEELPFKIQKGLAWVKATASGWNLEIVLLGPDARYNATIINWNPNDILAAAHNATSAFKKLCNLRNDPDMAHAAIELEADKFMVSIRKYDSGVSIYSHLLFTDKVGHDSFISALNWCSDRGPKLVTKCRTLDALDAV
jgi:hypothetical protein